VLKFTLKRVLALLPILLGVAFTTFMLVQLIPGDPTLVLLPPDTPAQVRAEYRHELHLDGPLPIRFAAWLPRAARGDFGTSIELHVPASEVLVRSLKNTAQLALAALLIAVVFGVGFGIGSAWWSDRFAGGALNTIVIAASSVPQFWFGLLLLYIFSVKLHWLPSGGMEPLFGDNGPTTRMKYMLLPAITVAVLPMALIARLTRALFLELRQQEFVVTLRTRGYSTARIWRHMLRNAAPGVVNIAGLQAGYVFLGTLFAEIVFSWPGVGRAVADAIDARDYPVIEAIVLVTGGIFAVITILVDVLIRALDPRVDVD
jgi:peptide/nickel transport system permease protein